MSDVSFAREARTLGPLTLVPFAHPQGCRGYLLADRSSRSAMAVDAHLDLVEDMAGRVGAEGWTLMYVVDTHTHADHPSGAGRLAARCGGTRVAHRKAGHAGVTLNPEHGGRLALGGSEVTVYHAPGHTPDHIVLVAEGALLSGDTLLIGGVARTDFLGGDAGQLFDSIGALLAELPAETLLFPAHDYQGRDSSTLGNEKRSNPWLAISERSEFVAKLTANPPPRPANMDDLLRLNREGVEIPASIAAAEAVRLVEAGGAASVIDVRTGAEFEAEHVPGSRHVPLDQVESHADQVRAAAAPRLVLCRTGNRAAQARLILDKLHVGGLSVVAGGLEAYVAAGGKTAKGKTRVSLERQVRIAAGSLVVAGVLLGVFVHAAFLALAGLVGAGLVFAGVTDWCGLGLLLARMPWNRAKSGAGAPAAGGTCAATPPAACAAGAPPPAACAAGLPPGKKPGGG